MKIAENRHPGATKVADFKNRVKNFENVDHVLKTDKNAKHQYFPAYLPTFRAVFGRLRRRWSLIFFQITYGPNITFHICQPNLPTLPARLPNQHISVIFRSKKSKNLRLKTQIKKLFDPMWSNWSKLQCTKRHFSIIQTPLSSRQDRVGPIPGHVRIYLIILYNIEPKTRF